MAIQNPSDLPREISVPFPTPGQEGKLVTEDISKQQLHLLQLILEELQDLKLHIMHLSS